MPKQATDQIRITHAYPPLDKIDAIVKYALDAGLGYATRDGGKPSAGDLVRRALKEYGESVYYRISDHDRAPEETSEVELPKYPGPNLA